MAEIDVVIQRIFKNYVILCIFLVLLLWIFWTLYPIVKKSFLKKQILDSELTYEIALRYHRRELLAPLYDVTSADWYLRNHGVIRIVNVGVKTGVNLKYFPNSSRVVAVDTKANLENVFAPFAKSHDNIILEKCVEYDGEYLRSIPSNYADAVVASFVLCRSKTGCLLNEIYRILAPGGKYYFIEHTQETRDPQLYKLQRVLSNCGLWPFLFDGCMLNINMERFIRNGPFQSVECKEVVHRFTRPLALKYVRTHILGFAVK